jgi:hypothetical protein
MKGHIVNALVLVPVLVGIVIYIKSCCDDYRAKLRRKGGLHRD